MEELDVLTFMMGEFAAIFPTDRHYAKNHMWGMKQEDGVCRFGFTAYAVRLLQDVYFLEWGVEEGVVLREKHEIGAIESKKAESALYSPMAGRLVRFNDELLADPSTINGGQIWWRLGYSRSKDIATSCCLPTSTSNISNRFGK